MAFCKPVFTNKLELALKKNEEAMIQFEFEKVTISRAQEARVKGRGRICSSLRWFAGTNLSFVANDLHP